MPIDLLLDHVWISILAAGVMPPVLYAAFRIQRRGGRVVLTDLRDAVLIGLSTTVPLLLLQVAVLTRELETTRTSLQHSLSTSSTLSKEPTDFVGQWHPNTAEQLINKVGGLTTLERKNVIKNDLGLLIEVEGEVWDVSELNFDDGLTVAVLLPNENMVFDGHKMAFVESTSEIWIPRLLTYQKGSNIRVVGVIEDIHPGLLSLKLHELK